MIFPTPEHIDAAQAAADRVKSATGFYCWPSVTLAQALIESAGWTRLAGKNNGFGIKATPAQIAAGDCTYVTTREVINGQSRMMKLAFANFASLTDAYEAHARLFVRVGVYKASLHANNPRQFVVDMSPHYATDPTYAKVILGIMDKGNYYQYDKTSETITAKTPPIKPPESDMKRAKPPAIAGAVVAAGGAIAATGHGGHVALWCGVVVAVIALCVAGEMWIRAQAAIADIPPVQPKS